MTTPSYASSGAAVLLPRTAPAPGQVLWGEAPQRQPIAPLILMAVALLLVAAPVAMAGDGGTANPVKLMRQVADSTWELTGLMQQSNKSLGAIDGHSKKLVGLQQEMGGIAEATAGMEAKTAKLNKQLGVVGGAVTGSRTRLASVDGKLGATSASMGTLRTNVGGSVSSTKAVVVEFGKIDAAIGSMDSNLKSAIGEMSKSGPLTKAFANNKTRLAIAGGSSQKYGVPNFAPDNRVMSIVLPMIAVMQKGGPLPARKDRHEASNPIVGTALKLKVPDGTNVVALVQPFDGFYGLPDDNFFVQNRVYGF